MVVTTPIERRGRPTVAPYSPKSSSPQVRELSDGRLEHHRESRRQALRLQSRLRQLWPLPHSLLLPCYEGRKLQARLQGRKRVVMILWLSRMRAVWRVSVCVCVCVCLCVCLSVCLCVYIYMRAPACRFSVTSASGAVTAGLIRYRHGEETDWCVI